MGEIRKHPALGIMVSSDGIVQVPFGGKRQRKDIGPLKWVTGYPSPDGLLVRIAGKIHKVHRLVAETFLPNPNSLPFVLHKDGNKENNSVDNLEWVSRSKAFLNSIRARDCKKRLGYHSVENLKQYHRDHYKEEPRHTMQLQHSKKQRENK